MEEIEAYIHGRQIYNRASDSRAVFELNKRAGFSETTSLATEQSSSDPNIFCQQILGAKGFFRSISKLRVMEESVIERIALRDTSEFYSRLDELKNDKKLWKCLRTRHTSERDFSIALFKEVSRLAPNVLKLFEQYYEDNTQMKAEPSGDSPCEDDVEMCRRDVHSSSDDGGAYVEERRGKKDGDSDYCKRVSDGLFIKTECKASFGRMDISLICERPSSKEWASLCVIELKMCSSSDHPPTDDDLRNLPKRGLLEGQFKPCRQLVSYIFGHMDLSNSCAALRSLWLTDVSSRWQSSSEEDKSAELNNDDFNFGVWDGPLVGAVIVGAKKEKPVGIPKKAGSKPKKSRSKRKISTAKQHRCRISSGRISSGRISSGRPQIPPTDANACVQSLVMQFHSPSSSISTDIVQERCAERCAEIPVSHICPWVKSWTCTYHHESDPSQLAVEAAAENIVSVLAQGIGIFYVLKFGNPKPLSEVTSWCEVQHPFEADRIETSYGSLWRFKNQTPDMERLKEFFGLRDFKGEKKEKLDYILRRPAFVVKVLTPLHRNYVGFNYEEYEDAMECFANGTSVEDLRGIPSFHAKIKCPSPAFEAFGFKNPVYIFISEDYGEHLDDVNTKVCFDTICRSVAPTPIDVLKTASEKFIAHRDVRMANIVVKDSGDGNQQVTLIDWDVLVYDPLECLPLQPQTPCIWYPEERLPAWVMNLYQIVVARIDPRNVLKCGPIMDEVKEWVGHYLSEDVNTLFSARKLNSEVWEAVIGWLKDDGHANELYKMVKKKVQSQSQPNPLRI